MNLQATKHVHADDFQAMFHKSRNFRSNILKLYFVSTPNLELFDLFAFSTIFVSIPKPSVSIHFKGPGATPSSRLDSHQNFEPAGMACVEFSSRDELFRSVPFKQNNPFHKIRSVPFQIRIRSVKSIPLCSEKESVP